MNYTWRKDLGGLEYSSVGGGFAQRERNSGMDPSMYNLGAGTWGGCRKFKVICSYTEMLKLLYMCVCVC